MNTDEVVQKTKRATRQVMNQITKTEEEQGKTIGTYGRKPVSQKEYEKDVPYLIQDRFIREKDKYYFPDRTLAFQDKGNKLLAKTENKEVVKTLVDIADHRQWKGITARGSKEFQRSIWLEASLRDIPVKGYKPTELEKEALERAKMSSDHVNSIENTGEKQQEKEIIEKVEAIKNDDRGIIKKHPEMVHLFGILTIAGKFAEKINLSKEDRNRLVEMTKDNLVKYLQKGTEVPRPKIRVRKKEKALEIEKNADRGR